MDCDSLKRNVLADRQVLKQHYCSIFKPTSIKDLLIDQQVAEMSYENMASTSKNRYTGHVLFAGFYPDRGLHPLCNSIM